MAVQKRGKGICSMEKSPDIKENEFPGFVLPGKGFIKLPNNWTDIIAEIDSLAELKIIMYILRHTWGYQEYDVLKYITIDEFMYGRLRKDGTRIDKGTKLSEMAVRAGIKKAIEHGYITCEVDAKDRARIKKHYKLKMLEVQTLDPEQEPEVNNLDPRNDLGVQDLDLNTHNLDPRTLNDVPRTKEGNPESHFDKDTITSKKESPPSLPSSTPLLEKLTDQGRQFWQWWYSLEDIKPALNEKAYGYVTELAPLVTSIEELKSLIDYSQKKINDDPSKKNKAVHLGNLKGYYKGWKQTYKPPKPEKDAPPASKEKLILWTRTPEDMENVEKFKHTRRGQVELWEGLRDSINWEWVTEEEARQHGWEEGRGFTDRERRELFAAKEAKELILWTEEPDHLGDPVANWYKYKMMTRGEAREKYKLDYYDELPAGVAVEIKQKFKLEELGHIKRPVLVS